MSRAEPLPQPLSIWIVNPFDDIPGEGIPPLRYWSLARVLAGRGHDVIWWSANWSHRRKARRNVPLGIREEEGFAVRLVAVRPYEKNVSLARLRSHRDFGRTFERLATESVASGQLERPDLIIASLPPLEGPEAAARLARRLDALLVVDVMDVWPETFARLVPGPQWLRKIIAPIFLGGMERRRNEIIQAADAISAASRNYLDSVTAAGTDKPTHVCPLGAYLQEYPEPPRLAPLEVDAATTLADSQPAAASQPAVAEQQAATKPVVCVYSGALEAGQDVETAIGAARQLASAGIDAEIHIAGGGSLEDRLRAAAAGLRGSCRVIVHGLLGRTEHARLLSTADIGLVLVKPESLVSIPYKACEYAAAGLAIVNSLPGELAGMIDRYDAGATYAAGDAASLAGAISTLARDRRRLANCRANARRLAEAEFDREKLYPQFARWLEQLPTE
ncbi:MAG: glycosyltransferase family 4 protein [Planctomycetia bacterium]|jgi:glycosyltransferase involved in cell wall biosynthesis